MAGAGAAGTEEAPAAGPVWREGSVSWPYHQNWGNAGTLLNGQPNSPGAYM